MKCAALLFMLLGFSTASYGDIFDRINDCERTGGGTCVYNLLRELARNTGGPAALPAAGAYRKTSGADNLCEDQHLVPVVDQGRLTQVKMGWCGSTYNITYDCDGTTCGANGVVINILDRTQYSFTNETNSSGIFSLATAIDFEGVATATKP